MKVCPTCKRDYGGGEVFCPVDATRLVTTSQLGDRPVDPQDPLIGALLAGRYSIVKRIGEGGMGLVYEGIHRDIDKRVAIKVLREDLSRKPEVVERFRQEAKSASRIGHDNIVDVSDFGETPMGASYFVMEHLDGEDLANVLSREGTIDADRACDILLQCCRALGAAHGKRIVHRDMKPENVFLTERKSRKNFVKIVDFGIAKMSDIETEGEPGRKLTKTGMIFGTPEYMSPEQAGGKALDHRVDIYALGVILYECIAGRVPFVGDTFMGILTQHLFEEPPPVAELNPGATISRELELVLHKALSKDPNDRYADMDELADALQHAIRGELSPATAEVLATLRDSAAPFSQLPIRSRGKKGWLAVAAAAVLIAIGVWWQRDDGSAVAAEQTEVDLQAAAPAALEPEPSPPAPVEPSLPAGPTLVTILASSEPPGATVRFVGGEEACAPTPCELEVPIGSRLQLTARRGRLSGTAAIAAGHDDTVHFELRSRKKRKRAKKAALAPTAPPPKKKKKREPPTDLKVPDIFR